MRCFVVFFSFWPSLKIKLFSVKKIQFFFDRKRPPVFLPVQLLMSRSLCQRCAVMSGAEWFCLLPEPKESCSLLLTEPLQAAGVIKPLLFLYCVIIETLSFSWRQMGAAHAPCLAYLLAWRSSDAIWAPRLSTTQWASTTPTTLGWLAQHQYG